MYVVSKLIMITVPTLTSLAKHYSVEGWEDWQSLSWDDSDGTQYECLETAVKAHPQKCLRALAVKWGLKYGQLEKTIRDDDQIFTTAQKRKADGETEPRRVKARMTSDCETEIAILSTTSEEITVRKKVTKFEPNVKVHSHTTLEELMRQYDASETPDMRMVSQELGWETSSSVRAARHNVRAKLGMGPSTPDEKRRVPRISPIKMNKAEDDESEL
jgi:hypothetical protein